MTELRQRNTRLVWDETNRIMDEVFAHWENEMEVHISDVKNLTVPVSANSFNYQEMHSFYLPWP